jgi:hypothetical protein
VQDGPIRREHHDRLRDGVGDMAQLLVRGGERLRPLGDAPIELLHDAALLAEEPRLLQRDRGVVRGDLQEEALGVAREVGASERGGDDADVVAKPEPQPHERDLDAAHGVRDHLL